MAITHTNHANANTNGNTSQAVMSLTFTAKAGRTVLGHRTHQGGLALQKPLYPERHRHICHALVLYTPAGIVQGDELTMNFVLKANTHAVLTTTGAGKWYGLGQQVGDDNRHDGVNAGRGDRAIHSAHHTNNAEDTDNPSHANSHAKPAYQHIIAHVADGAVLEWLPQESIYYRRACADSVNRFYVADTAGLITWDMGVLGRRAFGECFDVGRIYNAWQIWRNDTLLMYDCIDEMAGSGWFDGMLGLGGQSVFGTLYAVPSLARIHLPIGQPN
ncbi:MAG: urease accessory protein UreD, partial [Moraxella sp.]|nr:urease accessory protein UreD [Moraxella sp.]